MTISNGAPVPDEEREFDIVVFGATGFAGRLVCEYLVEHYMDDEVRWAIAGRNERKLASLREDLSRLNPLAEDIPHVVADSMDRASLDAMAARTTVICTTVGPYAKYGSELVAACVEHGTHYCDLTGEVQWIRRMLDQHHDRAKETGARIVHCCGFDSIPSDLGTLALQNEAIERSGEPCHEVKYLLAVATGGFSGGTIASMANVMEEASNKETRRVLGHPYSLNPEGEREGPDGSDQMGVEYDEVAEVWTAPFVMAAINTRIVRRSNALLDYKYGKDFRYSEATKMGAGPGGALKAGGLSAGLGVFTAAMAFGKTRNLLTKYVLPDPGEGPSRDKIENGFFKVILDGRGGPADGLKVEVRGGRDPGYGATATMLSEAALCLALQRDELTSEGGILTPAAAMGEQLIERLSETEVTVNVLN